MKTYLLTRNPARKLPGRTIGTNETGETIAFTSFPTFSSASAAGSFSPLSLPLLQKPFFQYIQLFFQEKSGLMNQTNRHIREHFIVSGMSQI